MKREVLSIIREKCRKNGFAIIIPLAVFIVFLILAFVLPRFIDGTFFYLKNKDYNILLSKSSVVTSDSEAYLINNDFLLQKRGNVISAQGIMLKENTNYSSIFSISSLNENEIIISKSIALSNGISKGDFVEVELNYSHRLKQYKVVEIYCNLFDIRQDVNIYDSPVFFVGYDQDYVNNSILTYLSFYNKRIDVSTIVELADIAAVYKCETRAIENGFVLIVLILFGGIVLLAGIHSFINVIDIESVLVVMCNSGIEYKIYNYLIRSLVFGSVLCCLLPLIVTSIVACIGSLNYLYCICLLCCEIILYCICQIRAIGKRNGFIRTKK